MHFRPSFVLLVGVLTLDACGDSSAPKLVPTSVELATAAPANAAAGATLAPTPTFVVQDQRGNPMGGVPATHAVSQRGGALADPPPASPRGATPVGQWTL